MTTADRVTDKAARAAQAELIGVIRERLALVIEELEEAQTTRTLLLEKLAPEANVVATLTRVVTGLEIDKRDLEAELTAALAGRQVIERVAAVEARVAEALARLHALEAHVGGAP